MNKNNHQNISTNLVSCSEQIIVQQSNVSNILEMIRPQWQSKNLILRVHRLMDVDLSSACQRLFNAAIHDLREKIVFAGTDIATEAAKKFKLPPITRPEDIEHYPTSKLIELAYRIGLLSRPDWRRICRCYEIRRDLEHEDDEYEAGLEDCIYIFKTSVEAILSKDPIVLVRVTDFRALIEEATPTVPDETLLEDYSSAPLVRQEEILKFLISKLLDEQTSDLVQQNAYTCLTFLRASTQNATLVKIGSYLQNKTGRILDKRTARIAETIGVFAYLRTSARRNFFNEILFQMNEVGYRWTSHKFHGKLLRSFLEFGGLKHCPQPVLRKILKWLVLTYLGEPGGLTSYGNVRHVYYSNSAAPIIEDILKNSAIQIRNDLINISEDKDIQRKSKNKHILRRLEKLIDLTEID